MSTTDTQVLAALNAWDATLDSTLSPEESLADYEPGMVIAMRAALDAANLDATRLHDGIGTLLPLLRSLRDRIEGLEDEDGEDISEDINTFCTFFAVLLEGQDVAAMFASMDALLDGEASHVD